VDKAVKKECTQDQVEEIKESLRQDIRSLDKLIDELAKGKSIEKILRSE
tara:strand:+ start:4636 stop:4782 length:147 start_codon:yes stop_codon:yes gene_type:complete